MMECGEVTGVVKAGTGKCCRGKKLSMNPLCLLGERKVILAAAFCRTEVTEGGAGISIQIKLWCMARMQWSDVAVKSKCFLKILLDFYP